MHIFQGETADEAWLKAADVFKSTEVPRQPSRGGDTTEIMGAMFVVEEPRQRWILSRNPGLNPAFALAEVVWIMNGRRDAGFLNYWNPRLPEFCGRGTEYHGAYGFRLMRAYGVDQLDRAYRVLRRDPFTRQVVLQIWDAMADLPTEDGIPANADIPCNVSAFLKVREGKLVWTQVLRSNDIFLGVPHNFVQFTSLQEILAGWLGLEVGEYRHFADCLHLYDRDASNLRTSAKMPAVQNVDRLRFSKEESDSLFALLAERMEEMTKRPLSVKRLYLLADTTKFPAGLGNWLRVIAADCARRRNWPSAIKDLMESCSNPVLVQLWNAWHQRMQGTIQRTAVVAESPPVNVKV